MSFDTFSQNTSMAYLIRGQSYDGSAFDEEYLNSIRGIFFARKTGNINTSMSAAPKLALVPASRYYCDVTWSYHNTCAKFH